MDESNIITSEKEYITLPMLALRGVSVYPGMIINFEVERPYSVNALNAANKSDRLIFLTAQKDPTEDMPEAKDVYTVGTVCRIKQQFQQPRSQVYRAMVEGIYRADAAEITAGRHYFTARVEALPDKAERVSAVKLEALMRNVIGLYEEYTQEMSPFGAEQMLDLVSSSDPGYISNYIAQNIPADVPEKQMLLEELRPSKRLEALTKLLVKELNIISLERELGEAAVEEMNKAQRDYYLHEQMRIIREELGDEDPGTDDIDEYREKIKLLPVSDEIKEKLLKEVSRLTKQPYGSSEASVIRTYLDTCLEIPWGDRTRETIDIKKAAKILNDEHYGLEKVKERILEYLAVKQLSPDVKGGLICLVGPPGTGKTSIAMSIAKAVNRKLVRISLGGVHDEAEIRGHRKTYVGSMPGRIVNGIIQAKTMNPLMVLDEIDKLGSDYRGDPSSALLEVFDAEQNCTFRDNFLEIPVDLSDVFFITTANTTDTIPRPLLDRMEIIELSSYTDEEKLQIAKRHLLPKQRKKHGLGARDLKVNDGAIRAVIAGYTRESGVRILERELAKLCRKAASGIAGEEYKSLSVTPKNLETLLGPVKFKPDERRHGGRIGLVRGLAYTEVGGEVLDVEAAVVEGTGKINVTGNLGDVMKESVQIAVTVVRSRAASLGINPEFYKDKDIHIHFPEGAVPKDGPSAGVTEVTAIASALSGIPVRQDIAMTGEVTLRGRVLAIGGLREKTMGALRAGVKTVICPKENEPDLKEIDPLVRDQLQFLFAETVDDVLSAALVDKPREFIPAAVAPVRPGTAESITIRQ